MRYYRPSVIDFADRAILALGEKKEGNPLQRTLEQFKSWSDLLKAVENAYETYDKSKKTQDFAAFLSTLSLAEQYLQKKTKDVDRRQENLEDYVARAIKIADTMKELNHIRRPVKDTATRTALEQFIISESLSKQESKADKELKTHSKNPAQKLFTKAKDKTKEVVHDIKKTTKVVQEGAKQVVEKANDIVEAVGNAAEAKLQVIMRDPEAQKFIDSPKFQALINYQLTLKNDNRDNTFLGFNLKVDKAGTLDELIKELKNCDTIGEIKDVLDVFYDGKGKVIAKTGKESPYEILNKGQNITTRFFNPFGMRSTTIELIDNLAADLGLGNDAPEQDDYGLK